MKTLRIFLIISTVAIYVVTIFALNTKGMNWPAVYFGDILELDWRAQFNTDFIIHLVLLATWIAWREGFTFKGYIFGFLSIFMGGMFGFLYILVASYIAQGDPKKIVLGVHGNTE